MRTWIGGQENLRAGDVIMNWSTTPEQGVTLEVRRFDSDTAKAVLEQISGTWNEVAERDEVVITGERWRAIVKEFTS